MMTEDEDGDHCTDWNQQRPPERRERILTAIRDCAGPLRLADLAQRLVDREVSEFGVRKNAIVDPRRLRMQLHHVDLPKLQNEGVIDYDPSNRMIE